MTPDAFIENFGGTVIFEEGTMVNGKTPAYRVDVVGAYNAVNEPDLSEAVGWTPTLFTEIHPTQAVPGLVSGFAGPFKA